MLKLRALFPLFLIAACLLAGGDAAESRHIWGKFWGGGGMQGGGGGPQGLPPAVQAAQFDFVVPMGAGTSIGSIPVTNLTTSTVSPKCTIIGGDPGGFYDVTAIGNSCALTVSSLGASALNSSHTDLLTVRATNSAGGGQNTVTVRDWALPVVNPITYNVTPPVGAGVVGPVTITNNPASVSITSCGTCVGFFSITNLGVLSTTSAASAIQPGQSYLATVTATNFAGSATGVVTVAAINNLPVVTAGTFSLSFPVANGTIVGTVSATNNPTSYTITSCSGCTNFFQISPTGVLSVVLGSNLAASTTYQPVVTATSPAGTSTAVTQTVNVGAQALPAPVMVAGSYTHNFPVSDGDIIGPLQASNSPTSFAVTSCSGCEGTFATNGSNLTVLSAAGVTAATTYHPVVTATNASGTSAGVAQNVTINPVAGNPPVVTAGTSSLAFPTSNGAAVGTVTATNNPTSFAIASCSGCTGFFAISSAGAMTVASAGGITASTTYNPVVTATNGFGTSTGVSQTVNVGAAPTPAPVVTASSYNVPFASVITGFVITPPVQASNTPTSFSLGACANCTGFFAVSNTGSMSITAAGAAGITANTSYNQIINATNATGTGSATQTINIGAGNASPPVVQSNTYIIATPIAAGPTTIVIAASNSPNSYNVVSCLDSLSQNCSSYFSVDNNGVLSITAAGAASTDLNGTVNSVTLFPVVQAINSGGSNSATQTIKAFADGSPNAAAGPPQHPNLFSPGQALAAASSNIFPNGRFFQVGDVLAVNGGTCSTAPQLVVTATHPALGDISGLNITDPGSCSAVPPNPVELSCAPADTSCHGTATSFNLQWTLAGVPTYATRPPWKVAGVDYAVGYPSTLLLKDPFPGGVTAPALVALGGHCDSSNHICTFAGVNNAVIDGYDFSLEGGWSVLINASGVTLKNSNFKNGPNVRTQIMVNNGGPGVTGVTITNNVVDGSGVDDNAGGGIVTAFSINGTSTVEYNWIKNVWSIGFQENAGAANNHIEVLKYNLIENTGDGAPSGAHGDSTQQWGGDHNVWSDIQINYNTVFQHNAAAGTQGFSILSAGGNLQSVLHENVTNNSVVALTNMNYAFIVDTTWLNGTGILNDNYVDVTGINGSWSFIGQYNSGPPAVGPYHGVVTHTGNINLLTGATFP